MAAGVISEGVLIIASVIVAGMITGIVISKVGATENKILWRSYITW